MKFIQFMKKATKLTQLRYFDTKKDIFGAIRMKNRGNINFLQTFTSEKGEQIDEVTHNIGIRNTKENHNIEKTCEFLT